jgi:hypothetical protein
MSSKQRVFSHSDEINYNDYIKNKNSVEILKNNKKPCIKNFPSHNELINNSKTYYNYVNLEKYSLRGTQNLYNSNISFVDHGNICSNKNTHQNECGDSVCKKSEVYNQCKQLPRTLYPESVYVSNKPSAPFLHFNLNMDNFRNEFLK